MNILVNTVNEQEEKVLIAFLDSLAIQYRTDVEHDKELVQDFIVQYNHDLDKANTEIEAGNFVNQDEVELLFQKRRNAIK